MDRHSQKEIDVVLLLDGHARFNRFIKIVADTETAWGLWNDGWALLEDETGTKVFPLWPAKEYAEIFRGSEWSNYEASEITVQTLLDELLPKLRDTSVVVGVFPTPKGRGVTPDLQEFEAALREELEKYTS